MASLCNFFIKFFRIKKLNTKNDSPPPSKNEKMPGIDYDFELYKILLERTLHDHTRLNDNFKVFLAVNSIFFGIIIYLLKNMSLNAMFFTFFIILISFIGRIIATYSLRLLLRILADEKWKFSLIRTLENNLKEKLPFRPFQFGEQFMLYGKADEKNFGINLKSFDIPEDTKLPPELPPSNSRASIVYEYIYKAFSNIYSIIIFIFTFFLGYLTGDYFF
jgi:hypothetical protein